MWYARKSIYIKKRTFKLLTVTHVDRVYDLPAMAYVLNQYVQ